MASNGQRQRESLHRQRQLPDWCTECSDTDTARLRAEMLGEKGLTTDERAALKLLVNEARRKQKCMDERVLRGLIAQREREDRANRLAGY